jgi:hypothetical protein
MHRGVDHGGHDSCIGAGPGSLFLVDDDDRFVLWHADPEWAPEVTRSGDAFILIRHETLSDIDEEKCGWWVLWRSRVAWAHTICIKRYASLL